jgi:DNA helicase-2/ATP-dependent DNA helicase PcrA
VNDISHVLKNKLNKIVHKEYLPSESDIKTYFESLIRLIYIGTKFIPPQRTLNFIDTNKMQLLNNLNENQKLAVLENKRIVFVNAGPGTGKTHLLVNKIYHNIVTSNTIENIVALSYTNSSARDLQEKLSEMVFYSEFKDHNIFSGTIHSFAFKSLRSFAKSSNNNNLDFTILDEDEIEFFADEIAIMLGFSPGDKRILTILKSNFSDSLISKELIEKVNLIKKKFRLIGFKDILLNFKNELKTNHEFIEWLKSKVSFILIDEAQDLTKLEYEILDLLIEKTKINLFLVGDPRQNIFGFNGGSFEYLNDFLKRNSNISSEMVLNISYRCPDIVLNILNKFEFIDCKNYPICSNKSGNLIIRDFEHKQLESKGIIEIIKELNDNKNTAILFTSLKYFDILANHLNDEGIAFRSVGGSSFLKKHIRLMLHFISLINDKSNVFSWRYITKYFKLTVEPNYNIITSEEVYNAFKNINDEITIDIITQIMSTNVPSEAIFLINKFFIDSIKNTKSIYTQKEIEVDLGNLFNISKRNISNDDFLTSFALNKEPFKIFYKNDLDIKSEHNEPNNAITLSTIHSAKGLEWKNVIMPGLADGLFPNPFFCEVENNPQESQKKYNDELKKLYVGMSRTLENLVITYPLAYNNKYGRTFFIKKSRFINKMNL